MATSTLLESASALWTTLLGNASPTLQLIIVCAVLTIGYFAYSVGSIEGPVKGLPIVSLGSEPGTSWSRAGSAIVAKGLKEHSGPFQVSTGTGYKVRSLEVYPTMRSLVADTDLYQVVFPNRFAEELRKREELSFNGAAVVDFFPSYPGFEAAKFILAEDSIIQQTVRGKLTQSLDAITSSLVDECTNATQDVFGDDSEWHATLLKQNVSRLVARLSARVFLGKPLCRNQRCLGIATDYTVDFHTAAQRLRETPAALRPIRYWFIDECTRLRKHVRTARELVKPEVELRKQHAQQILVEGKKLPQSEDSIGWMYELTHGRDIDYAAGQLSMILPAMHSTTEALSHAVIDLCQHPGIVEPLRREVKAVISDTKWAKGTFQKLRLMDAFLKESQRHHPIDNISMRNHIDRDITLSDGSTVPANSNAVVAAVYRDPSVYENPDEFDLYRFFNDKLEPGKTNPWSYSSLNAKHMGFGFGDHACPGRFFAANEMKVALCHLLMKYEFKIIDGEEPRLLSYETNDFVDPLCRVSVRRIKEDPAMGLDG